MIVLVFVDDLIITGSWTAAIKTFKRNLKNKYTIEDLGEASVLLGINLKRNRIKRTLALSQERYIQDKLVEFGLDKLSPTIKPADPTNVLTKPTEKEIEEAR